MIVRRYIFLFCCIVLLSCNNQIIYDRDATKIFYVENDSSFVDEILLGYDGISDRIPRTIAISYLYVNRHTDKKYWSSSMPTYYRAYVYESKVDLDTYKSMVKYIQSLELKEGMPHKTYEQWGASSVVLKHGNKRYHKSMKRREYVAFLRGLLPLLNNDSGLQEAVSNKINIYQDDNHPYKYEDMIYGELDEVEFNGNNKFALQLKSSLNIDYVFTDIAERIYNNKLHPYSSHEGVPLYLDLKFNRNNIDSITFDKFRLSSTKIQLCQEGLSTNLPTEINGDEQLPVCYLRKLINNNNVIYIQVVYCMLNSCEEAKSKLKEGMRSDYLSDAWFVYYYDKKAKQFVYKKYIINPKEI
ncbi:MAG: hypothetical protein IKT00_10240 [Prevotella sp.]|nr:hypothetical protein [Prevotella sp.]